MATIFDLKIDPKTWPDVVYCVWQKELCPTTKKEHYQLFVQFAKRKRRTHCLKLYKGDWRPARSAKNAAAYCQKEDTRVDGPWTIGSPPPTQGEKFHAIYTDIKDGLTEKEIFKKHTGLYIRYSTGIRRGRELMTKKRTEITQIIWIWGPSGSGKSTYARKLAQHGDRSVFFKHPTNKWFDGYNQEDVVVIDDYKGALYPALLFNLGGNKHPLQVEVKGGSTQFASKEIIITSVRHPRYIYGEDTRAWQDGLQRRVSGYTLWINEDHEVFKTDWIPAYKEDPEAPPTAKRTKVIDEEESLEPLQDLSESARQELVVDLYTDSVLSSGSESSDTDSN